MRAKSILTALAVISLALVPLACKKSEQAGSDGAKAPVFTLAWSEYPSWSVFGVASDEGLIDGKAGHQGSIEKKWNVDIQLDLADYDTCLQVYGAKKADGVCMTNMDALSPAAGRKSVAILPTSTSAGADACIVVGIKDLDDLKKHTVHGLKESVSQYAFARVLEKNGRKDSDYTYEQMEPDKAATAMQAKIKGIDAIMVWNPFVLQTLKVRKDAKRLFDSSAIPEEIIDMVIVGQDVLDKPGGDRFACAVIDTYYQFNQLLKDPTRRDELLVKLGKKFSDLNRDEMEAACTQTSFYKTPEEGLKLMAGEQFPKTMDGIVKFWVDRKFLKSAAPKLGYGSAEQAGDAQLRFDPTYIRKVQEKK
jgi:ABC-type nitrate/sulfonate/bicarbonate transport system substrate-binding protein